MTLFVVTNKRNGSHTVDLAKKWMFKDHVSEAISPVRGAKCFQRLSRAVKIFDRHFFNRRVQRFHSLRSFHAYKPDGNNRSWDEPADEPDALRCASNSAFKLLDDVVLDEAEVMNYFGNTPFAVRGSL